MERYQRELLQRLNFQDEASTTGIEHNYSRSNFVFFFDLFHFKDVCISRPSWRLASALTRRQPHLLAQKLHIRGLPSEPCDASCQCDVMRNLQSYVGNISYFRTDAYDDVCTADVKQLTARGASEGQRDPFESGWLPRAPQTARARFQGTLSGDGWVAPLPVPQTQYGQSSTSKPFRYDVSHNILYMDSQKNGMSLLNEER